MTGTRDDAGGIPEFGYLEGQDWVINNRRAMSWPNASSREDGSKQRRTSKLGGDVYPEALANPMLTRLSWKNKETCVYTEMMQLHIDTGVGLGCAILHLNNWMMCLPLPTYVKGQRQPKTSRRGVPRIPEFTR